MSLEEVFRSAVPDLEGMSRLQGLEAPVELLRDAIGVPHVRASSVHDAFFAQGFVHAQDRLWQMTYDRYRAAGRLAELLGPRAITMDMFVRRMGLEPSARADYDSFDPETRSMLDAYAAGVNAFCELAVLPAELRLLGMSPERWEPWTCGAVFKVRHVLMGVFDLKLWRARLLAALGPEATAVVGSPHGREDTVIVPVEGRGVFRARSEELEPGALAAVVTAAGSNSWALHGDRTASGQPLVAGDPHRLLEVPNVYYQNHVACPEFDAIGLSMPGVPGMVHFGHNASVAWCITHGMADTQDLYVERFSSDGRYEFRGQWLDTERRTERIKVRDGSSVDVDVTVTHHGPVVFGDPSTGTAISMRWTATEGINTSLRATVPMLRASSVDELEDAMRWWVDPCNSLVTADVHGAIAYLHRGRVPVRSRSNGWVPVPGWTGKHEWSGDVPFSELPRLRDPESGLIVTANNRVCSPDYHHYLGFDYGSPNRARRILDRLHGIRDATAEDMARVHADVVSLDALAFRDVLAGLGPLSEGAARARELLDGWDGTMDPDAVAPCVYAVTRERLAALLTSREPMSRVATNPFAEEPYPTPVQTRVRAAVSRLLSSGDRTILGGTQWPDVLPEALADAVTWLEEALGSDPSQWRWGRLHKTRARHPLSRAFPEAAEALDPAPVPYGGDRDTVFVSAAEVGLGVEVASVARYVFDLGDWDRSGWIVPLGASGHQASPHYADQAADWAAARLQPMTYTWARIEAGAETSQRLEPR